MVDEWIEIDVEKDLFHDEDQRKSRENQKVSFKRIIITGIEEGIVLELRLISLHMVISYLSTLYQKTAGGVITFLLYLFETYFVSSVVARPLLFIRVQRDFAGRPRLQIQSEIYGSALEQTNWNVYRSMWVNKEHPVWCPTRSRRFVKHTALLERCIIGGTQTTPHLTRFRYFKKKRVIAWLYFLKPFSVSFALNCTLISFPFSFKCIIIYFPYLSLSTPWCSTHSSCLLSHYPNSCTLVPVIWYLLFLDG